MFNHKQFYQFLGIHSLLIGLFPFFIPVYLWNAGYTLTDISLFIAVSGLSFCVSLRVWEWTAKKLALHALMTLTLLLELALLGINLNFSMSLTFLAVFGIANGIYNCFFWTTQRTLFLEIITTRDSGRQYGNFQIFVMVFLKGGIFAGGFLLEHLGFSWVFSVSSIIVLVTIVYLWKSSTDAGWFVSESSPSRLPSIVPVTLTSVFSYNDSYRSKSIFVIDGLFLFLESHFWTISLFLVTKQNYANLGIMVIALAVIFALLFYIAKNRIDAMMGKRVYQCAVIMYCASWFLRSGVSDSLANQWLFMLLLIITFFSSFFRLAFNKRFYDTAKESTAGDYLIIKSYYTQAALIVIFGIIAAISSVLADDILTLKIVYFGAGLIALAFLRYRYAHAE